MSGFRESFYSSVSFRFIGTLGHLDIDDQALSGRDSKCPFVFMHGCRDGVLMCSQMHSQAETEGLLIHLLQVSATLFRLYRLYPSLSTDLPSYIS